MISSHDNPSGTKYMFIEVFSENLLTKERLWMSHNNNYTVDNNSYCCRGAISREN